ncbi:MAG: hypothetical protein ABSH41_15385 [Syntrophobacteraceae bacterium]|jgi:hypothetical protein
MSYEVMGSFKSSFLLSRSARVRVRAIGACGLAGVLAVVGFLFWGINACALDKGVGPAQTGASPRSFIIVHEQSMGASRWCFGKDRIIGEIDLTSILFSKIKGIEEGKYKLDEVSGGQLQLIARDVIQPYIDIRLHISVDGKNYPVGVTKLERKGDNLYTIYLIAKNIHFHNAENQVKIYYSLIRRNEQGPFKLGLRLYVGCRWRKIERDF